MVSGTTVSRNRIAGTAIASPAAAPSPASTRLSVRNCATSRPRPAPSAVRTATSRPRTAPRDISRFARLTHPMSSRAADAAEQHDDRRVRLAGQLFPQRRHDHRMRASRDLSPSSAGSRPPSPPWPARSSTPGFSLATTCALCHDEARPHPRGKRRRHPDIDVGPGQEEELLRHHADHFVRVVVHAERAAQDIRRSAETALPQAVADDGRTRMLLSSSSAVNTRPICGVTPSTLQRLTWPCAPGPVRAPRRRRASRLPTSSPPCR